MAELSDIVVPDDLEGNATLACWLNRIGDTVVADEPLIELETDKVNVEISSPGPGILAEILVAEGGTVAAGQVLGRIRATGSGAAKPEPAAEEMPPQAPAVAARRQIARGRGGDHRLSPAVRQLLREHDLDAARISGSGQGGRITRDDVLAYLEGGPITASSGSIPSHMVPHDSMRRSIAAHMVNSLLRTAPHVTAVFELDLSRVIAHRKAHKAEFAARGESLTFTAYFVFAAARALKAVPQVNSRYHAGALEIFDQINIGVGTALGEKGLIVPVIHDVYNLDLSAIVSKLIGLTEKARTGSLTPKDVANGTFTISNHGVSGSLIASPIIINQPQSAILGIGKLQKRVVVVEEDGRDTMAIRPMAFVTLTIDHRVLDAHHTNTFLTRFVEVIETWS